MKDFFKSLKLNPMKWELRLENIYLIPSKKFLVILLQIITNILNELKQQQRRAQG